MEHEVVEIDIQQLKHYDKNPRGHNENQIEELYRGMEPRNYFRTTEIQKNRTA